MPPTDVRLRPPVPADAPALQAIYNREVGLLTMFDLVPRSVDDQLAWIERHRGGHPAVVAIAGGNGDVVGFASLSPYRERPAYNTTVENSVYVRHDQRGRGIGRTLLGGIVDLARSHGFHTVIARIVATNDGSIRLHRACGFEVVGIEREVGRKQGQWLDVAVMQTLL